MLKNLNHNDASFSPIHDIPKAIIFDWDNTIVNTWLPILEAMNQTLEAMGLARWDFETYKQKSLGRARADFFPEIFGSDWNRASDIFEQAFYSDDYITHLELIPEMATFINMVSKHNVPLCVVSSKEGDKLRYEAEHLGISNVFRAIVGAGDAARNKPSRDIVYYALEQAKLGFTPSAGQQVWFVGDAISDVECAYNSGCVPVLYGNEPMDASLTDGKEFPIMAFDVMKANILGALSN
ncbi:MAG: HAD family hydrolase [Rickettsiales bacterium]|nr:HAD family hydrolase [Rickettsiales bacterium]